LEPSIDGLIGLPAPSGNYVDALHGQFDTIFVGS